MVHEALNFNLTCFGVINNGHMLPLKLFDERRVPKTHDIKRGMQIERIRVVQFRLHVKMNQIELLAQRFDIQLNKVFIGSNQGQHVAIYFIAYYSKTKNLYFYEFYLCLRMKNNLFLLFEFVPSVVCVLFCGAEWHGLWARSNKST